MNYLISNIIDRQQSYPHEQVIELFVNYAKTHALLDKSEKNLIKLDANMAPLIKCNDLVKYDDNM